MNPFSAIYYPSWNPPPQWLRAALLVYDRIEVILPEGLAPKYNDLNQRIIDVMPDAWGEIRETNYTEQLTPAQIERTRRAVDVICKEYSADVSNELVVVIGPTGSLSIEGHTFLHQSKCPQELRPYLKQRELIRDFPTDEFGLPGFEVTDSRVSDLLISTIADHYASKKGMRVVTDRHVEFALHESNGREWHASEQVESRLASIIIGLEIPECILQLTTEEYRELRERYVGVRQVFHRAMSELAQDYNLGIIHDESDLATHIDAVAEEFSCEVARFRVSDYAHNVKAWVRIGLRLLANLAGASSTRVVQKTAEGFTMGLDVYGDTRSASALPTGYQLHAQRTLASLQSEIFEPKRLQRIWRGLNGDIHLR